MKLFDNFRIVSCIQKRFILNLLVFFIANKIYPEVFETVGYMYEVNLNISSLNLVFGSLMLLLLTLATNFKNIIYRHTFDVCILGIFLPIAVVTCQIDANALAMFYSFASICAMSLAVRLSNATRLIKGMGKRSKNGVVFSRLQLVFLLFFLLVMTVQMASNIDKINFNLIDTYIRTYDIRAEHQTDGFFGYFIGWFILLFFPLFLCKSDGLLKYIAPAVVFVGAFLIFQTFAVKVIFLNFFLVFVFSFFYQRDTIIKEYLPQFFFLLIFVISFFVGLLSHPLLDRFFYTIGINSIFYIDFFYRNSYMFFEGTKLDLGLSNYGIGVGYLIDYEYYQGSGSNASAGFIPTMFADLGFIGIIIASLVIGWIMTLIKTISSSSESFAYLAMIALAFSLMNSSFNMLFMSNGLVFIIIFSVILRRQ